MAVLDQGKPPPPERGLERAPPLPYPLRQKQTRTSPLPRDGPHDGVVRRTRRFLLPDLETRDQSVTCTRNDVSLFYPIQSQTS
jgi:hypothetical protein